MIQLMLVEDDPVLGRGLHVSLEHAGYQVHWARDLTSATQINSSQHLDLVLLDLGLPDGSGLNFLKAIRKSGSRIPILILTAMTDELSVVAGLQSGANDYIRKPFGKMELLARIKTALREPQTRENQIRCGDLLILIDQRRAIYKEIEIELKRREFDVLTFFARHFETVISRESLIEGLKTAGEMIDRTIDSHVSHLRTKLKQGGVTSLKITSIYGVGYRMEKA